MNEPLLTLPFATAVSTLLHSCLLSVPLAGVLNCWGTPRLSLREGTVPSLLGGEWRGTVEESVPSTFGTTPLGPAEQQEACQLGTANKKK